MANQDAASELPKSQDIRTKLGRFLGADSILIGTLKSEKEEILINARVVDLQSGVILATAQTIIAKYLVKKGEFRSLSDSRRHLKKYYFKNLNHNNVQ